MTMREPKTIREFRVALRYAQGEANIAQAEAALLREHIERHRRLSMARNEAAAQDYDLWKVIKDEPSEINDPFWMRGGAIARASAAEAE